MAYDFDTVHERRGTDSSKWSRFDPDVIPMPVADMDFPIAPPILEALRTRLVHPFLGYGAITEEIQTVFADRLQRRYGWHVVPEAIIPIPGVIPGFNVALRGFTSPGDSIVLQTPAYPPILKANENHGLQRHEALLVSDEAGRYEVDWPSFEAAFDATTRAFVLCNPHNPVGRVFSPGELERMGEVCLRNNALIISDEIHCDLALGGSAHTPIASLSPEIESRTITLMAPSKTFNLAGMKASIAIIPNAEIREKFEAARTGLVGAINILGAHAMLAAYRDCDPWLEELTAYLTANRDYLSSLVAERLPGITMTPLEGTYLAWLDCNALELPDNDAFTWFLENARVGLGEGVNFGERGEGFVRLNFGCPRPLLEEALERIATALVNR
jgi:cysteine-S-conjugate beta-lyase